MKRKLLGLLIPVIIFLLSFNNESDWQIQTFIDGVPTNFNVKDYALYYKNSWSYSLNMAGWTDSSKNSNSLTISLLTKKDTITTGTYPCPKIKISDTSTLGNIVYKLFNDKNEMYVYDSDSGYITISSLDSFTVQGSFKVHMTSYNKSQPHTITGNFKLPIHNYGYYR